MGYLGPTISSAGFFGALPPLKRIVPPFSGNGAATAATATWTDGGAVNQGLFADNGSYHGKFSVNLPLAKTGGADSEHARGIEIDRAESLGGALDVATPDALTLNSWNGLIAKETLTLNAVNRGIDLKANAFFEVASGKTMTIAEPIRSEGGFFKRGAGALALDSAITFGVNGMAEPDGTNSKLTVKEGSLRCVSTTATEDLDIVFGDNASLEIDPTTGTKGLVCRSLTFEGVLPVTVDFGSSYVAGAVVTVPLFTVSAAVAQNLIGRIDVRAKGSSMAGTLTLSEPSEGLVTIATTLTVPIPEETKIRRLNEIIALQNELSAESNASMIGKTYEVLVENYSKRSREQLCGRTEQNKMVVFDKGNHHIGDFVNVRITASSSATLIGEEV